MEAEGARCARDADTGKAVRANDWLEFRTRL